MMNLRWVTQLRNMERHQGH